MNSSGQGKQDTPARWMWKRWIYSANVYNLKKPPHRTTQHVSVASHDSQSGMNFDVVSDTHARFPQQMLERRVCAGIPPSLTQQTQDLFPTQVWKFGVKAKTKNSSVIQKRERTCWQILLLCIYNNSDFKNYGLTNVKQVGASLILKSKHVPHNRCETLNRIGTWNMYTTVRYMRLDWFLNTLPPFRTPPPANINTKYKVCNKNLPIFLNALLSPVHTGVRYPCNQQLQLPNHQILFKSTLLISFWTISATNLLA